MNETCEGVTIEYQENIPVVTVNTDLRGDAVKFKSLLKDLIDSNKRIIIVVGEKNYLYDEFVGISVSAVKNAYRQNKKVAFVCAPQHQYDMLDIMNLIKVLDVFRNLEDAISYLKKEDEK